MVFDTLNLKTPVPCIQGFFSDRIATYVTQMSPKQIMNLLGHDPRSKYWKRLPDEHRKIYEYLQRKTSKDRRESVSLYIEERLGRRQSQWARSHLCLLQSSSRLNLFPMRATQA